MDIHERLKYLRGTLHLTTRAFGASINMSGSAVTNMENGARNITERTIQDICRVHNVNPNWLTDGMEPIFEDMVNDLNVSEDVKELARQYSLLNSSDRELIKKIIHSLAEKSEKLKNQA